jgi:hypothetical protein
MMDLLFDKDGNVRWGGIVLLLAILLIGVPIGVAQYNRWMGWQLEPIERTSVDNVKREADWFSQNAGFLKSQYANIGVIQRELAAMGDGTKLVGAKKDLWLQKNKDLSQATIAYNNACGQYQAAFDNFFHGSVAPANVPRDCRLAVGAP